MFHELQRFRKHCNKLAAFFLSSVEGWKIHYGFICCWILPSGGCVTLKSQLSWGSAKGTPSPTRREVEYTNVNWNSNWARTPPRHSNNTWGWCPNEADWNLCFSANEPEWSPISEKCFPPGKFANLMKPFVGLNMWLPVARVSFLCLIHSEDVSSQ